MKKVLLPLCALCKNLSDKKIDPVTGLSSCKKLQRRQNAPMRSQCGLFKLDKKKQTEYVNEKLSSISKQLSILNSVNKLQ